MEASVKCSNCGAEIKNLTLSPGKCSWWSVVSFLPVVLILVFVLLPLWRMDKPKGDYRADLAVTVQEKRMTRLGMEILGTIENRGQHRWESIELDAEFYGPDGSFLDEGSGRIASSVDPGKTERFKIQLLQVSSRLGEEGVRMDVKVAHAYFSRL